MDTVSSELGTHPQPVGYYLRLAAGTFRTMLDLGMLVVGSALVGLALVVLGDGLDVLSSSLELSTAAMLGSSVAIGLVGAFAFGIASEGRYGANATRTGFPGLEVAIGRLVGVIIVSVVLLWAAGMLEPIAAELVYPFEVAVAVIRAVGTAGFVVAVVGVPAAWAVRRGLDRLDWGPALELPAVYVIWTLATLLFLSMP